MSKTGNQDIQINKKPKLTPPFHCKQFTIVQENAAMKVGTDGCVLGAWAGSGALQNILDIGTGTGLIALMMAQRFPDAIIQAVEIDKASAAEAALNFAATPWKNRLSVHEQSIQDFSESYTDEVFDLIVSNPPFFSGGVLSAYQDKASVRHTVKLSHSDLLRSVRKLLSPNGAFALILPHLEGLRFIELAQIYGLHVSRKLEVLPKAGKPVERILLEFTRTGAEDLENKQLVIQFEERNHWTPEFTELLKDFYLHM